VTVAAFGVVEGVPGVGKVRNAGANPVLMAVVVIVIPFAMTLPLMILVLSFILARDEPNGGGAHDAGDE
jgi:hypothetical protein